MSSLPDSPKKGMGTRRNSNLSLFGENHLTEKHQPVERPYSEPLNQDCDADQQGNSHENAKVDESKIGNENINEKASPG